MPRPRRRGRRRWRSGVAALAAIGVAGAASATPATTSAGTSPGDTTLTLSATVLPGDPVPMDLVRTGAAAELGQRPGAGIDVAMIDSGVAPVVGLHQPGKVLHGPDLSNEGGNPNLAHLDTYGHGTHLAGIIVGDDGDQVLGMAPESRVVSVKVAGATGETDVAQVIAAIEWVVQHRNDAGMNIRVLNLALGLPASGSHLGDPLAAAVEQAWKAGIVVVVAAGNRGNGASSIDSPAISPFVVATGGLESYDAWGVGDRVGPWSSGGQTRTPDLVAAGRSIQSFRVPGSFLDQAHPSARVGDRYFVGTGTSQAAAVTSGYVAGLLSRYPYLTADQVKYLMTSEADDLLPGLRVDGHGSLDPKMSTKRANQAWKAPRQLHPSAWAGLDQVAVDLLGASWSGGEWNGASWSGGTWSGASWAGASWAGASWSGGEWSGASWAGASWAAGDWSGASWSGASWSGASWAGASWAGASWAGEVWR